MFLLFAEMNMSENPWQVDSIQAFSTLMCPECPFNSKGEKIFESHAVKYHPLSSVLFGKFQQELGTVCC